jgi:hypothetical protein
MQLNNNYALLSTAFVIFSSKAGMTFAILMWKKHFYKEVIKKDSKVLQMVSEVLFNTWWV